MESTNWERLANLLKNKEQIEALKLVANAVIFLFVQAFCFLLVHLLSQDDRVLAIGAAGLTALFKSFPSGLLTFEMEIKGKGSFMQQNNLQENLAAILSPHCSIVRCLVYDWFTYWNFRDVTTRNKKWKEEQRFKSVKVASFTTGEPSILGKRGSFVPDDENEQKTTPLLNSDH